LIHTNKAFQSFESIERQNDSLLKRSKHLTLVTPAGHNSGSATKTQAKHA